MSVSNLAPTSSTTPARKAAISRTNWVLSAFLLLQVAIAAYMLWPTTSVAIQGAPIFGDITADQVTSITISDDADRTVTLARAADVWSLAGTDGYPANAEKVATSLQKLLDINTDRLVTRTAGSHNRLQVGDESYLRKIELGTAEGTKTIYLGSSGGASATHVRPADADPVYLSSGINTWELDTAAVNWIDVTYFATPIESIQSVTVENAAGTVTLARDAGNAWTLPDLAPDETIVPANIDTFVGRIATLNLHTVLGKNDDPAYGLASPQATLTVSYLDDAGTAQTVTLLVGAKDEATDTYYLKSSASDYYVRLAAFTGDEFVNQPRADFLTQPAATDAPAPGADGPAASPDAAEVPAAGLPVTATESITATPAITPSTPLTQIDVVTQTDSVTETTPVTPTSAITASATVTASAPISPEVGN